MNTIEEIIEWIENYDNPSENIEKFAYELGEMLKDMDYTASNGGAAVGYAGVTGSYEKINTGIYLTVDNFLNYEEIFQVLKEKSLAMQSEEAIYRGRSFHKLYKILIKCVAVTDCSLWATALA